MHRLIAALLCLIGLVAAGLAVASATVWRPSDTLRAEATADGSTLLVTDPGVLDLAAEEVTVVATAPGDVVLALGRTSDVDAWVGTDAHTRVTGLVDRTTLATAAGPTTAPEATASPEATVSPEATASAGATTPDPTASPDAADDAAATEGEADAATAAPDPTGSDLWIEEVRGDGRAELALTDRPGRFSVLAASVGEDAGPPTLTLEWPQEVRTPWLVPGLVVGGLLVLLGVLWFVLARRRGRRDHGGPRRRRGARAVPETSAPATPAAVTQAPVTPAPGRTDAPVPSGAPTGASSTPTSPTWTVTPEVPSSPAADPASPPVPLTRRQLREMERRREAEAAGRTRGPATGPVPTSGTPSAAGSEQAPPAGSEQAAPTGSDPAQDPSTGPVRARGPVSRLSDRFQRRVRPGPESQAPPTPATPPRPGTPPGPASPTGATSGPTTRPEGSDAGQSATTPTWPVRSTSPNATAEAWRRAWGFPATGADPATGEAGARRPDDTDHRPDDAHGPDDARGEEDR